MFYLDITKVFNLISVIKQRMLKSNSTFWQMLNEDVVGTRIGVIVISHGPFVVKTYSILGQYKANNIIKDKNKMIVFTHLFLVGVPKEIDGILFKT